jgi:hypothetical protein
MKATRTAQSIAQNLAHDIEHVRHMPCNFTLHPDIAHCLAEIIAIAGYIVTIDQPSLLGYVEFHYAKNPE